MIHKLETAFGGLAKRARNVPVLLDVEAWLRMLEQLGDDDRQVRRRCLTDGGWGRAASRIDQSVFITTRRCDNDRRAGCQTDVT